MHSKDHGLKELAMENEAARLPQSHKYFLSDKYPMMIATIFCIFLLADGRML